MTIEELKLNGWKDENGNYWNPPNSINWIDFDFNNTTKRYSKAIFYWIPGWFINQNEDLWLSRNIRIKLSKYNRTLEEFISRFHYNLPEVPKCASESCTNKVKSRGIKYGLNLYCCFEHQFLYDSPHYHKSIEGLKNAWKDPNSKFNDGTWSAKRAEYARAQWSDPEFRKYLLDKWKDKDGPKRHSEYMKSVWADENSAYNTEEYRNKISESRVKLWNDPNSVFNSKEFIDGINERLNNYYSRAKGEYYKILSLGDINDDMILYVGIVFNQSIKYGVTVKSLDEKAYRYNLNSIHQVIIGNRLYITRFEAEIKLRFQDHNEYIELNKLYDLFNIIKDIKINGFKLTDWI